MKKLLLAAATIGCLVALAPVARARSAYDGSWDLVLVTQRGACDPTYNFSVNITNGVVTHPNLVAMWRGPVWFALRCQLAARNPNLWIGGNRVLWSGTNRCQALAGLGSSARDAVGAPGTCTCAVRSPAGDAIPS